MKKLFISFLLLLLPMVVSAVTINGIAYNLNSNSKTAEVTIGPDYSGFIVIPSEVTYNNVKYVVTSIGERAFYNCEGIKDIKIPNSVTSIGSQAFYSCNGLYSVTIPNSVTTIGSYAFYECSSLRGVNLGNKVTSIGYGAFYLCNALTSVTVDVSSPPSILSGTFSNQSKATLYVPYGSKAAYEVADCWKDFKEIIEMAPPTCATPVLNYQNGKIRCSCETEDVKYVYTITASSSGESNDGVIELGTEFVVSVRASRDGYQDSEPATITIDLASVGDMNGDDIISIADVTGLVNVILGK